MHLRWIACLLLLWTTPLAGCDLLLVSATAPGMFPGMGHALTGKVMDSQSGLPIGNASVTAGWGGANTDSGGNFTLYGDFSGARTLSIARAGYVSLTNDLGPLADGDSYYLDPIFASTGSLTHRSLNVTGTLWASAADPLGANGNVCLAGMDNQPTLANGGFSFILSAGMPGQIFSGVLAGGQLSGGPVSGGSPFNYQSFGYRLIDFPSVDVAATTVMATTSLQVQNIPFQDLSVSYPGLSAFGTAAPTTEVYLDFGMLGSIIVARGAASGQTLHVPNVAGVKYVIKAKVADSKGNTGVATEVTNLNVVSVPLLPPPSVQGPLDKSYHIGGTPTFAWAPVPGASSYRVEITEDTGGSVFQKKWVGYTTRTSLSYPGFWDSDYNGGFLFQGATYSWSVHAVSADSATFPSRSGSGDVPSVLPFRQRQFESSTGGMRFTR